MICTASAVPLPELEIVREPLAEVHYTGRLSHKVPRLGGRWTPETRARQAHVNRTRVVTPEAAARKSAKCRAAALRRWGRA